LIAPKPQYPDGYGAANDQDDDDDLEAFHQQSIMQDQDEQLEDVGHTVGNLRQQAREMGEELDDQVVYFPSA
jgi:member of the syntaxin family of t-SNAREs